MTDNLGVEKEDQCLTKTHDVRKKATVRETYFITPENSKLIIRKKKNKRGHRLKSQCKTSPR